MDVQRTGVRRKKAIRNVGIGVILTIVGISGWRAVAHLKPAAPTVERATIWPGTVKRGPMIREVRGLGTLVTDSVVLIPAVTDGRVEKIMILPGTPVKPDTVIMKMANPEVELAAVDYEWQVKAAEANYRDLKVKLETQKLTEESKVAQVRVDFEKAKMQAERDAQLLKDKLVADLTARQSQATADALAEQSRLEAKSLGILDESLQAQLAAQQVQIEKLKATYELKKQQVQQLVIRAGVDGVLQEVVVKAGQRVTAGTQLATVAQPWNLKAELKIPETQAKDIQIGQLAMIDTRNGIVEGRVARIDPAVINGTRTVDVHLPHELPKGAVPDLSVDGTIQLEKLDNVVYVERPVTAQPNSRITLFKIAPDGKEAVRVPVQFGRSSVSTIEVVNGLNVGDQVILSDMSAQDNVDRIQLK